MQISLVHIKYRMQGNVRDGEFRELYITRKNKNHEDMGVVASKRYVN